MSNPGIENSHLNTDLTSAQLAAIKLSEEIYKQMYEICLGLSTDELSEVLEILIDPEIDNVETYYLIAEKIKYLEKQATENTAKKVVSKLRRDFLSSEEVKSRTSNSSALRYVINGSTHAERSEFYGLELNKHYSDIEKAISTIDINELRNLLLDTNLSNIDTYIALTDRLNISPTINTSTDRAKNEITNYIGHLRSKYLTPEEFRRRVSERMKVRRKDIKMDYSKRVSPPMSEEQRERVRQLGLDRTIFSVEKYLGIMDELYNSRDNIMESSDRNWPKITEEFNARTQLGVTEKQIRTVVINWKKADILKDTLNLRLTDEDKQIILQMLKDPSNFVKKTNGRMGRDYPKIIAAIDPNGVRFFSESRMRNICDKLSADITQ